MSQNGRAVEKGGGRGGGGAPAPPPSPFSGENFFSLVKLENIKFLHVNNM